MAVEATDGGRRVGVLVHDVALAGDPALLGAANGAAALRLANDRLEVELRAQLEALRQSRARVVQAGDDERRRVERDLHDGAQQRLVGRSASCGWPGALRRRPRRARAVGRALDGPRRGGELRDLARASTRRCSPRPGWCGAEDLADRSRFPPR